MSELLPPNAKDLERAAAQIGAKATDLPVIIRDLWNPEACPPALLPWLAWAWSVDEWSDQWTDRQKRNAITSSLEVQKHKGTLGAVKGALSSLGFESRVQEWFKQTPPGEAYTFRIYVDVDQYPMDQAGILKVLDIVNRNKSLRSELEAIIQEVTSKSTLTSAAASVTGNQVDLTYSAPRYSNGEIAWDLMTDSAYQGVESTTGAIDNLNTLLHETMTTSNYW